jgi:hypothetical protein
MREMDNGNVINKRAVVEFRVKCNCLNLDLNPVKRFGIDSL